MLRFVLPLLLLLAGCATIRVTDPPQTADEQFLQSEAIREAVAQLAFSALRDRKVFLSDEYLLTDEEIAVAVTGIGAVPQYERLFLLAELRNRMLIEGVELADSVEAADVILEVRSGAIGVNREDFLLGIPGANLPAGQVDVGDVTAPVILPELAILRNIKQKGFASVSITAYFKDTGELVASSGPFVGRTRRTDFYFFGIGPRTTGNIPPTEEGE
ncbi:MAG: DUF6655 family protein [Planctomycetota bacterium]